MIIRITLALLAFAATALGESSMTLWYQQPALKWTEALPVGNGRMGAMIFGGPGEERLQLNEDTLYAGGPYDPANPDALGALPEVRRLIFAGEYAAAQNLAQERMMARPLREMPYEPLGDLYLTLPDGDIPSGNYRRELDIGCAIAKVIYTMNGVAYQREIFCSAPDQALVMRWSASRPGMVSFRAHFTTPQRATARVVHGNTLVLSGANGEARGIAGVLKFQARLLVKAEGGSLSADGDSVTVRNANAATLLITAATSYRNYHDTGGDPEAITSRRLRAAARRTYEELRTRHLADYQALFQRVRLDLGTTAAAALPTDKRIENFPATNDLALAALYFQFGRYLLISSSRPGGQPANLQGLWNESMTPPWDSKYTININTEMNYWPAETCNLPDCVEPLTEMVLDLTHTGARTAKVMYNAAGWVAHHNTDLWRATAPVDGAKSGMWPTGGAWLCQNLWEHYLFSGDRKYLATIYPALKGAAEFFLETLVTEPKHGWLVTCPSMSPENAHHRPGVTICDGPTLDMEILRDLFSHCVTASELLGCDQEFRGRVRAARERLAPLQIGHAGQLQEWLEDWDMDAPDIHHRHVSHLYALYPSDQIDWRTTPELAAAAKRSLEIRGDEATGWATAWRINLWARLHDGDHAYRIFRFLLSPKRTYPDMFDAHPPFQIDGNFGGTAAMAEMLLQSQRGEIEFLPALPSAWPAGTISGLRARGGFEVSESWRGGRLAWASVTNVGRAAADCRVRYGQKTAQRKISPGENWRIAADEVF